MEDRLTEIASFAPGGEFPFDLATGFSHGYAAMWGHQPCPRPVADPPDRSWYAAQQLVGDPVLDAPLTNPRGGCVYTEMPKDSATVAAVLNVLGVPSMATRYAVGMRSAYDVAVQRFAVEVRVIVELGTRGAGLQLADELLAQPLRLDEFLWRFTTIAADDERLYGAYGEDGDDAYAEPAFGFWVENADFRILRCWSRPWLVTK